MPTIVPAVVVADALTGTVVPDTVAPFSGAAIVGVTGDVPPPATRTSGVVKTSNDDVPCVQARPIWVLVGVRLPVMKLRDCVPMLVPGTADHAVHVLPLNFVNRIELALSLTIANSQTLVPSVAPKRPPPDLKETPLKLGGAVSADQLLFTALYVTPSTPVPLALARKA